MIRVVLPMHLRTLAGTERELAEGAVVDLKPGLGFSKKVTFKRG